MTEPKDIRFEAPTFIDPLTGLFNRYYLNQLLPEELKKAQLSNYPVSILMVDLDGYKKINDTHGHLCGDKVLIQISQVFKKSLRQTDTVIRYAGDEFIIILPAAGIDKTPSLCGRMVGDVQAQEFTGDKNQKLHLTISVGFAIYPQDSLDPTALIDLADKALYLSKKRGRNRYSSSKEVTIEEVSSLVAMEVFPCRNFINQQQELGKLKEVFDAVSKSNAGQAVFISGPSGAGKSRIMQELSKYTGSNAINISCKSSSPRTLDPYYLFSQGIGSYMEKSGVDSSRVTDILLKMPMSELSELSLIIPQVRLIVKKEGRPQGDEKQGRFLLFKGLVDLLIELSKSLTVAIFFDDIQWADKASLQLLRYLIKQEKNNRIFIACSQTKDTSVKGPDSGGLEDLLKEIEAEENVAKITLKNLSPEDTSGMVNAIFPGIAESKEFIDLMFDTTKGNPSFIEEILKSLVENGIIFYQGDNWQIKPGLSKKDFPSSLEEILQKRLKNLDDETKEMILQAAVIGENFQTDLLSKIQDKGDGFVSEAINRARKLRLIDEVGGAGGFNFINKHTKDILYNQLKPEQQHDMHYKIAQILSNQHKDNLYDVAGEVAFHLNQAPQEANSLELSRQFMEKTEELFDPGEITGYIASLASELLARGKKVVVELSDRMMKEATKVTILLQGAVKKFRLYPPASSVRMDTVKEILPVINKVFNEAECITVSEVEKSLVINGKRLSPSEVEYSHAEHFLPIIMDHNIKTISFKKGLQQDELNKFIHYLAQSRNDVINKGGWKGVINKEGLSHVGIDEVQFTSVDEYSVIGDQKKKLRDTMLMEFLLGRVDPQVINKQEIIGNMAKNPKQVAQTIMDITNITAEKEAAQDAGQIATSVITKINSQILSQGSGDASHAQDLSRVIMELEPKLRNRLIRSLSTESNNEQRKIMEDIVGEITDDAIIDIIIDEYKNNADNPLFLKEFLNDILVKEERRAGILRKLETRLSKLAIPSQDLDFIMDRVSWKDLSLDSRIGMLLGLPRDSYSISVLGKIKGILEEADSGDQKEELKNIIPKFLLKTDELDSKVRRYLFGLILDFMEEPLYLKKDDSTGLSNGTALMLQRLETETDTAAFSHILDVFRRIIEDFISSTEPKEITFESAGAVTKRHYLLIDELFSLFNKRLKAEEEKDSQVAGLIKNFILDISTKPFLEILVYRLLDRSTKGKYDIQQLYQVIQDKFIDTLIGLATKKNLDLKDPFREFLFKKRISGLLIDLKSASVDRLKSKLSETKDKTSPSLIELVGYLKNEELVDSLVPFIHHGDSVIRIATILALSGIGGARAVEALSKIAKEEQDTNLRELAVLRLSKLKKKE